MGFTLKRGVETWMVTTGLTSAGVDAAGYLSRVGFQPDATGTPTVLKHVGLAGPATAATGYGARGAPPRREPKRAYRCPTICCDGRNSPARSPTVAEPA